MRRPSALCSLCTQPCSCHHEVVWLWIIFVYNDDSAVAPSACVNVAFFRSVMRTVKDSIAAVIVSLKGFNSGLACGDVGGHTPHDLPQIFG